MSNAKKHFLQTKFKDEESARNDVLYKKTTEVSDWYPTMVSIKPCFNGKGKKK